MTSFVQPEETTLTAEERETYLRLQKKVGNRRTGTDVFESFFQILPMIPCELAVLRQMEGIDHVLMWHRKDAHYEGWHMPGGYLFLGETFEEWVKRVISKETGMTLRSFFQMRTFNTRPETGWVPNHQVAHFFRCVTEGEPSRGQFFPLTQIPEDTLGHHKKFVEVLRAEILREETMRTKGINKDGFDKAPEWKWMVVTLGAVDGWVTNIYDKLDDAVKYTHANRIPSTAVPGMFVRNAFLLDDQGRQIL
jgi:ADP-ribose pyrophosphatase YjhB (NUDIX family)